MAHIKLIVFDVDGTLTDGKIYLGEHGEVMKAFNIKDGLAIKEVLPRYGIIPAIITGRKSTIVQKRCAEIGIVHLYQGIKDKVKQIEELLAECRLKFENVAYMGDDINDLECMKKCAVAGCPHDAIDCVKAVSKFIADSDGGCGAAREFIEWLLKVYQD